MNETIKWAELTPEQRNDLAAEIVMGRREKHIPYFSFDGTNIVEAEVTIIPAPPAYSTDMNAAWAIVEHLAKLPTLPEESEQQRSTKLMLWWEKSNLWAMSAEEAAEAICVVALRICGCKVET